MSSDLLREFADPQESPRHQGLPLGPASTINLEDDEFGDFEDPEMEKKAVDNSRTTSIILNKGNEWGDFEDRSVFFDADQIIAKQHEHTSLVHVPLRSLNGIKTVSHNSVFPVEASPTTAAVKEADFEDWPETFIDPINPAKAPTSSNLVERSTSRTSTKAANPGPPPSNVPPPSVLLPLVTTTFRSLAADVKMVVSSGIDSSNHSSPLDQARMYQVKDALATARAGARIIAGRKLRWKRDTLLSQSMKTGPASSKLGGMKLAGLDKTESRREDAEAAEAVRIWQEQVGGLRSAIAKASLQMPVPEMLELMPIRILKVSEGAVTAPKCCFLCGVKRDERVSKVDVSVEDSFGEWWTEHWGHVDCTSFWADHKASLSQR